MQIMKKKKSHRGYEKSGIWDATLKNFIREH